MAAFAGAFDGGRRARGTIQSLPWRGPDRSFSDRQGAQAPPRLPGDVPRGTGMTRVVALANQKGGVGKTTTAINLGASLAACERKVLLIDLDPQANATSGLGLSKNEPDSIYPVLLDGLPLASIVRPTELSTLKLAPSSVDLVGAELELGVAESRDLRLKTPIATL